MPNAKKSLAETHPEVAKQWHPTLNGDLTPNDITKGSVKRIWWKCNKGDDHEWEASPNNRTNSKTKCPICSGTKVALSNCLATTYPKIANEWHPSLNGNLTPFDLTSGSSKKVWWKCNKGDDHEWEATLSNRTRGGDGCPVCSGAKLVLSNSLSSVYPEVAEQWHPTKNGNLKPENIYKGSHKKVWWKCNKGDDHEWETSVVLRTFNKTGCPVCSGSKVVLSNSIATTHPKLAKEWHPTKNGNLSPSDIGVGSSKKIWWKCDKGDDHEWIVGVGDRVNYQTGCPICSKRKIVLSNCLATTNPKLAKEWHPTKNGDLTPYKISRGHIKNIWWKCDKGDDHEWQTSPLNRSSINMPSNCPFCTITPQSKQELTITFELMKFFKNIDPKGFKTRLGDRLRAIDIYIPKLKLCIEFDGSYWHKGKRELDKIKSEMLFKEGFKLIRVREEPLKKIYDTDVISKQPYNGKQVTNDILSVILEMYELDDKIVSKINEYQSKDKLQNEKGLERYIDKILTEKAERKSSKTKTAK